MADAHDELVARLHHLVSLDAPDSGGPYGGFAAAECMRAMREAAEAITALRSRQVGLVVMALREMAAQSWALEIMARAHDAEESAQMGEPSPWCLDEPLADPDWQAERRACAMCALEALADAYEKRAVQEADAQARQHQQRRASR